MEKNDLNKYKKKSVLSSIVWKFLERGSSVIVTLFVNIILARLLDPSTHGLLAIVGAFVAISEIFVTAGLGSSLIQKKNADELDFSSVFWINLLASLLIYVILFIISPMIAEYFGYPILKAVLRVLGIRVLISAANSVQRAYVERNMLFRNYFFSTLLSKVISGVFGIGLAFLGYGVWALVAQSVSLLIVETVVIWVRVKWRPKLQLSMQRAKGLYAFAWKLMLASLVGSLTDQLRNLVIGKQFSSVDLAYYNKGLLFPNSLTANISYALSAVMFPVLSSTQGDEQRTKIIYRQWISLFSYCMLPILTGLAVTAPILIPLLLTEKWTSAVPYLQIACGIYASWVIEIPISDSIKATGRSDVYLYIQIIKTICSIIALLVSIKYGVMAIAVSALICSLINVLISAFFGHKYLGYNPLALLKDVLPAGVFSIIMGGLVALIPLVIQHSIICLIVQVIFGVTIYLGLSFATHNESMRFCINLFMQKKVE